MFRFRLDTGKIILGKLMFCFLSAHFYAHGSVVTEEQAKAHYVLETARHITWPNDASLNPLTILVLGDEEVYKALLERTSQSNIRQKELNISMVTKVEEIIDSAGLLYVARRYRGSLEELYQKAPSALVIVDGLVDRELLMVNFITVGNDIKVNINRDNVVQKGFVVTNSFVEFAGTKSDVSQQLRDKEKEFRKIQEEVKLKEQQLAELKSELELEQNNLRDARSELLLKEQELKQSKDELNLIQIEIQRASEEIEKNQQDIALQQANIEKNQEELEQRELVMDGLQQSISENQAILEIQLAQLNEQKNIITVKESQIDTQRKLLIVATSAVAVFLVMSYVLMRLSRERKKSNEQLEELNSQLYEFATIDSLTGLYNRRHFLELAQKELLHQQRRGLHAVILMLDIDHFKEVNDTYGHAAGDEALAAVAGIFKDYFRDYDIVGRLGGEEYAMMLVDCDLDAATDIADRLRLKIEDIPVVYKEHSINLTASIGISKVIREDSKVDDVINRADKALYQAKENGRNRVCLY